MTAALPPPWPAGTGKVILDEIDSTNAEALRRAPGLTGPLWVLARRQTGGRGRRGRAWVDPAGNFAATLALPLSESPARMALRSFTAALALHEALEGVCHLGPALKLKWPNDLLLNGGKLSGILLESGEGGVLAIGIGVNLHAAPAQAPDAAFAPVSLREGAGHALSPERLLDHLAPAFARWEALYRAHGFAPLRATFLEHAARLGETITARTGSDTITGRFETIDETGALILVTAQGQRAIPAADIHF
jgi:BirA family transcriptional regulator, biotin operon repressor / biotin---[acetyl-CoA-carboxylase] ligase